MMTRELLIGPGPHHAVETERAHQDDLVLGGREEEQKEQGTQLGAHRVVQRPLSILQLGRGHPERPKDVGDRHASEVQA